MSERITNIKIMKELNDFKLGISNEFNDFKSGISNDINSLKSDLRTHVAYHKSNGKALEKIYNDFYEKDNGAMFKIITLWNEHKSRKSLIEKIILTVISAIAAFVAGTYYR